MTAPQNDPQIADPDELLRRIPDTPNMTTSNGDGGIRPSSAAIQLRKDEEAVSVDQRKLLPNPEKPSSMLEGHPESWGIAMFTAADARADDMFRVVGDKREDNPAHSLLHPTATSRSAQKRNFTELAKQMTWVPGHELPRPAQE